MSTSFRTLAVALALAAVVATTPVASANQPNDAWITTKAKIALLTTRDLSATGIDVDTRDGKITLHGTVPSDSEKERAASVAKGIDGVTSVQNLLQVVKPKDEERVEAKDEQIEDRVEQALAADQRLDGSDIRVGSVNNGVVLLRGTAESMNDHLEALNVVGKVPGVRRVESEVEAPDRLSATESTADDARAAADGVATKGKQAASDVATKTEQTVADVGTATSDAWITSQTKMRLLADGDTPGLDINVDTEDGVVTLVGTVPSEAAKQAAEANARKVDGVRSVKNELRVDGSRG